MDDDEHNGGILFVFLLLINFMANFNRLVILFSQGTTVNDTILEINRHDFMQMHDDLDRQRLLGQPPSYPVVTNQYLTEQLDVEER